MLKRCVSLVTGPVVVDISSAEDHSSLFVVLIEGKLANSAVFEDLSARLSHLTEAQCTDVVSLSN